MAYVPMQTSAAPAYEAEDALLRGTLFPGLDLPFMGLVNRDLPSTPLAEMMAIDFVVDELELYLDTHAEDEEAFALYQTMLSLQKEARERYARRCGPILQSDMLGMDSYAWLSGPWPWEYCQRKEK
ncbi:MAG: spore coat protein CotJB [Oscillospiraceae bacterium]|nr:spore coat protein CotJB [Oscillospiraceae bacterium]